MKGIPIQAGPKSGDRGGFHPLHSAILSRRSAIISLCPVHMLLVLITSQLINHLS
ncbi:hypothetical protein SAMN04487996_103384 [Dyadobacter soli]|uniref:Uncharacterized protein n=1 Tax=Dyadobacter soli TaxID=659014 RepID=A0A1G7A9Q7_9BACT|nr:hypothetical protein SAMN04487996_103384 [Dyadobacter soli]